jgi:hypothetical protein
MPLVEKLSGEGEGKDKCLKVGKLILERHRNYLRCATKEANFRKIPANNAGVVHLNLIHLKYINLEVFASESWYSFCKIRASFDKYLLGVEWYVHT